MTDLWQLPACAVIEDRVYRIRTHYRDILYIIDWLTGQQGGDLPLAQRWYVAMNLFYPDFSSMPRSDYDAASHFMTEFLSGGRQEPAHPGPRLLDWHQDAALILAGINQVLGRDVRTMPQLHWWSFLSCFDSIGEGTLSTVVGIRDKLRRGKKLEPWELEFYRSHRQQVDLRPVSAGCDPSEEEAARKEKEKLLALLRGESA